MRNQREGGGKPPRPKRTLPGIAAVFSAGRWRWRANICSLETSPSGVQSSRQRVGTLRDSQRAAFDDVESLRKKAAESGRRRWTLIEALNELLGSKIDGSGLSPHSIERGWRAPCREVLKRWRANAPMEAIDFAQVRDWALFCLDQQKLAGPTVRKMRLGVLHHAYGAVGLPSPVPEVVKDLAKRFRRIPKAVDGYDVAGAADVLERARAWRPLPGRKAINLDVDILIMELAATTGMRHDEIARLRRCDVDLARGLLAVTSKVRTRPRLEPIVPEVADRLRRRVEELKSDEDWIVPGYGGWDPKRHQPWEPCNRYLGKHRARWRRRLNEPMFNLRALRRAHGSGLDELGASYAVVRDALGHSRTSAETPRYLLTHSRAVNAAKRGLAAHLIPPLASGLAPAQAQTDAGAQVLDDRRGPTGAESAGPHQP